MSLDKEYFLNLYLKEDLHHLGLRALEVKEKLHGKHYYYTINRHINYTNICLLECKFCSYYKKPTDSDGYTLSIDKIMESLREEEDLREVHIVGGLNPAIPYSYYINLVKAIKEFKPNLRIRAFTCVEIDFISRRTNKPVETILTELKEAGLTSLPGGGAEISSERIRKKLYPRKISFDRWLEIAKTAHRLGIKTNATLLFGHIETEEEIIDHLIKLRQAQEETGGFEAFIPLPFIPANTKLSHLRPPSAQKILRTIAIARILLDNFPHIKAYWVFLGVSLAQIALLWGADHIHGTVKEERISEASRGTASVSLAKEEIENLIKEIGGIPILQ